MQKNQHVKQLHETVQQKCYCKISYGTTFDMTRKQSRSGATPFDSRLQLAVQENIIGAHVHKFTAFFNIYPRVSS